MTFLQGISCITCENCGKPLKIPHDEDNYYCPQCGILVLRMFDNDVTCCGTHWGAGTIKESIEYDVTEYHKALLNNGILNIAKGIAIGEGVKEVEKILQEDKE